MNDVDMLQYIHKSAELGKVEMEAALRNNNDPVLRKNIHSKLRIYQEIYCTSANSLLARGIAPQSANPFRRWSALYSSSSKPKVRKNYQGNDPMVLSLVSELKRADEC